MIYAFGDSFTYGYNFLNPQQAHKREDVVYCGLLGKKLNEEVNNLSVPGNSNWHIARNILKQNFTENDFVIIAWTSFMRLELGCSTKQLLGKSYYQNIVVSSKIKNIEKYITPTDEHSFIEKDGNICVRRFFPKLLDHPEKWADKDMDFYNFTKELYMNYISEDWMEEMFLIMFSAVMHKLSLSKCKFVMFNTFTGSYSKDNELLDIPEYIAGYKSCMSEYIRKDKTVGYWSEHEHEKVANILYNYFTGVKL